MKCSRTARGFAFGNSTGFAADLKLTPGYGLGSNATFPSSASISKTLRIPIRMRRPAATLEGRCITSSFPNRFFLQLLDLLQMIRPVFGHHPHVVRNSDPMVQFGMACGFLQAFRIQPPQQTYVGVAVESVELSLIHI